MRGIIYYKSKFETLICNILSCAGLDGQFQHKNPPPEQSQEVFAASMVAAQFSSLLAEKVPGVHGTTHFTAAQTA
jgi:hypothetical protein